MVHQSKQEKPSRWREKHIIFGDLNQPSSCLPSLGFYCVLSLYKSISMQDIPSPPFNKWPICYLLCKVFLATQTEGDFFLGFWTSVMPFGRCTLPSFPTGV